MYFIENKYIVQVFECIYFCLCECDIYVPYIARIYYRNRILHYYYYDILDAFTSDVCISISDDGEQHFGNYSTNENKKKTSWIINIVDYYNNYNIIIIISLCRVTIKSLKEMSSDLETENGRHRGISLNLIYKLDTSTIYCSKQ